MDIHILVVDDEPEIADLVEVYLRSEGFLVHTCGTAGEALAALEQQPMDLAILDVMLPDKSGFDLCGEMRREHRFPVLMLTARTSEMDKVKGLETGADDYVVKPFGIMELQARVKALLRRTGRPRAESVLTCGDLEIDPAAREVRKGGQLVELTYKEFELLRLLCAHRGMVLTRDDILQAVWDYDFAGETRTVDMHIKTLRQKLGEGYIQTVRGVGYKMA